MNKLTSLFRVLYILQVLSVLVVNTVLAGPTDTLKIIDYGEFIADIDDYDTRQTNFETINGAIEHLGQNGGGILAIPADTFYIGPNLKKGDFDNNARQAIKIAYSNITICGAGIDKTLLRTNGTFVDSAFVSSFSGKPTRPGGRANGIWVYGTGDKNNPLRNIVFKDFEIDGQAGWTGNYSLDYLHGSDEGWDMWHKGILTTGDGGRTAHIGDITFENVSFHHFRGEVLYGGGNMLGKLYLKNVHSYGTNASVCNLHASEMLVEDCFFGKESDDESDRCRFWIEITGRQFFSANQTNQTIFRNNIFRNQRNSGAAIAICQGDYTEYEIIFENNDFDPDGKDLFDLMGGIYGPVRIHDNTINDVQTVLKADMLGGGDVPVKANSNVYFERNTITDAYALMWLRQTGDNFQVRDNTYRGKRADRSYSITWDSGLEGWQEFHNNLVEGNTFSNCKYPQHMIGYGSPITLFSERPLHRNNTYDAATMTKSEGNNLYTISADKPKITPNYEEVEVYATVDGDTAVLETNSYPDGQVVVIWGGAADKRVKFVPGHKSYYVLEDKYLDGTDTVSFYYKKDIGIWVDSEIDHIPVEDITTTKTVASIVNGYGRVYYDISPSIAFNKNVSWKSLDESIARVVISESGEYANVQGVSLGSTAVVVTTEDGSFTDTCVVNIVEKVVWNSRDNVGITVKNSDCGSVSNASITVDPSYIIGGTGSYIYSLYYDSGDKSGWWVVEEPFFEQYDYIQASNVFNNLAEGTYKLSIYDAEGIGNYAYKDLDYQMIILEVLLPDELIIDEVLFAEGDITGAEVSVTIKGGIGGTYDIQGSDHTTDDGNHYYLTVTDREGVTVVDKQLGDTENTVVFAAPSDNFEVTVTDEKGCSVSEIVNLTSAHEMSVNEESIVIYPNPTTGLVTVGFEQPPAENAMIRVFNHIGQLIAEKPAYSTTEDINLSGQTPGIYFVNISGGNTAKTLKLVVQ